MHRQVNSRYLGYLTIVRKTLNLTVAQDGTGLVPTSHACKAHAALPGHPGSRTDLELKVFQYYVLQLFKGFGSKSLLIAARTHCAHGLVSHSFASVTTPLLPPRSERESWDIVALKNGDAEIHELRPKTKQDQGAWQGRASGQGGSCKPRNWV